MAIFKQRKCYKEANDMGLEFKSAEVAKETVVASSTPRLGAAPRHQDPHLQFLRSKSPIIMEYLVDERKRQQYHPGEEEKKEADSCDLDDDEEEESEQSNSNSYLNIHFDSESECFSDASTIPVISPRPQTEPQTNESENAHSKYRKNYIRPHPQKAQSPRINKSKSDSSCAAADDSSLADSSLADYYHLKRRDKVKNNKFQSEIKQSSQYPKTKYCFSGLNNLHKYQDPQPFATKTCTSSLFGQDKKEFNHLVTKTHTVKGNLYYQQQKQERQQQHAKQQQHQKQKEKQQHQKQKEKLKHVVIEDCQEPLQSSSIIKKREPNEMNTIHGGRRQEDMIEPLPYTQNEYGDWRTNNENSMYTYARFKMIARIREIVREIEEQLESNEDNDSNDDNGSKLSTKNDIARMIELDLYHSSSSFQEYDNKATIKDRVEAAMCRLQDKLEDQSFHDFSISTGSISFGTGNTSTTASVSTQRSSPRNTPKRKEKDRSKPNRGRSKHKERISLEEDYTFSEEQDHNEIELEIQLQQQYKDDQFPQNLNKSLESRKRFVHARIRYQSMLQLLYDQYGSESNNDYVAQTLYTLGMIEFKLNEYNRSKQYCRLALEMYYRLYGFHGGKNINIVKTLQLLSTLEHNLGDFNAARKYQIKWQAIYMSITSSSKSGIYIMI